MIIDGIVNAGHQVWNAGTAAVFWAGRTIKLGTDKLGSLISQVWQRTAVPFGAFLCTPLGLSGLTFSGALGLAYASTQKYDLPFGHSTQDKWVKVGLRVASVALIFASGAVLAGNITV